MSEREDALEQRKSDATSDETADDVQETGKDSARDPGPSPDGGLDEENELKDSGPM